ncbi:PH domain-containing protein [Paenibacillus sp. 1P07SE]|uniref:PH domain-containing protein n=1 Tax=Paenibacillus sp. 1P07SE TaxID=3132209 RepID=UPI0039A66D6F
MKKSDDMQRLHPLSVIFFIGKTIKDLLYPLIVFFLTTILRENVNYLWLFGGVALFLVLLVLISWLTWLRYTYAIEPGGLRVEHGVFVRKKLWIGRERVQSVDTSAGVLHRLFGLKKLQVETAGGKKPEAVLNGISAGEGLRISRGLGMTDEERSSTVNTVPDDSSNAASTASSPAAGTEAAAHTSRTLATRRLSIADLAMYSATSGKIGVVRGSRCSFFAAQQLAGGDI